MLSIRPLQYTHITTDYCGQFNKPSLMNINDVYCQRPNPEGFEASTGLALMSKYHVEAEYHAPKTYHAGIHTTLIS